ncbi:hypothetical protein, partial [Streptomyces sp. AC154]|uniref:hypothetical protein n=1 Tax=Streptomyces sp. AC154 TaxID=3143184 RepID=UPI003F7DC799
MAKRVERRTAVDGSGEQPRAIGAPEVRVARVTDVAGSGGGDVKAARRSGGKGVGEECRDGAGGRSGRVR